MQDIKISSDLGNDLFMSTAMVMHPETRQWVYETALYDSSKCISQKYHLGQTEKDQQVAALVLHLEMLKDGSRRTLA
jgi:hypothetical protein